jgi:ParB-like chromosome segregation protein Spo0J
MAKRIESWPLSRLRPYERNPRTHSAEQVDKIARSIQAYGFTNPILVDENDGILAGHGRLMAARKLRLAEVPVIPLTGLTEEQKRAYIIMDNRLALDAGWDEDLLRGELEALQEENFDLLLTGFEEEELEEILAGEGTPSDPTDPSDAKIGVFVNCRSSRQQKQVLALLNERGYDCRAVN